MDSTEASDHCMKSQGLGILQCYSGYYVSQANHAQYSIWLIINDKEPADLFIVRICIKMSTDKSLG